MLPCQAIHLWMFDGGRLRLVSAWGEDATAEVGATEDAGEGYVADMAEEGAPLLINDPDDPRLATRNERAGEGLPITNALLVPLIEHEQNGGGESELGVLEAVNKAGGRTLHGRRPVLHEQHVRDGLERTQECQPDVRRAQAGDSAGPGSGQLRNHLHPSPRAPAADYCQQPAIGVAFRALFHCARQSWTAAVEGGFRNGQYSGGRRPGGASARTAAMALHR